MIKKFFLSVLLCAFCMLSIAQSQTITHVVQRGETLESIAEYYKVSVEDINKANPNADGIVYVGMKLVVPVGTTNAKTTTTVQHTKSACVFSTVVVSRCATRAVANQHTV